MKEEEIIRKETSIYRARFKKEPEKNVVRKEVEGREMVVEARELE